MSKPYAKLDRGSLLISSPDIEPGVFSRSVILLCEHSVNGSFGLILNKSFHFDTTDDFSFFDRAANPKVRFCMGGPVQAHQMMLLHSCSDLVDQSLEICPSVYLGGDVTFLQECLADESGPAVNLCFGYTGWQAGQLEREFLDGLWFLSPGNFDRVFSSCPEMLWSTILLSLGGKYASLSTVPENLLLN